MSALRQLNLVQGFGDPCIGKMAKLEQVIKGIKRVQATAPQTKSTPRLPISPELLLAIKRAWEKEKLNEDQIMIWAAALLCFFGFLRSGEVCVPSDKAYDQGAHLSFRDVVVDNPAHPQSLQVKIKASKTDPFRQGVAIYVGRTNQSLCPVAALLAYMVMRGNSPGPLFRFQNGRHLTRPRFVKEIRVALALAGIDPAPYSGHSFRIGAATTAAQKGVSDSTIKMLGRWKSSAYQLYIKTPREKLAQVSRELVA